MTRFVTAQKANRREIISRRRFYVLIFGFYPGFFQVLFNKIPDVAVNAFVQLTGALPYQFLLPFFYFYPDVVIGLFGLPGHSLTPCFCVRHPNHPFIRFSFKIIIT